MEKQTKSRIIKGVCYTSITAAILTALSVFAFTPLSKEATAYGSFYTERENSLDFVLIGNSTVREDFIPVEAWKRYGLTSHCIGSNPTHLEVIKIAVDEVARTQNPKIVFIDVNGLTFQNQESAPTYVKAYYDAMPNGDAKDALKEKYPYVSTSSGFELFSGHNGWRDQYWWETKLFGAPTYNKGYNPQTAIYPLDPIEIDENKTDTEWFTIDPGVSTNPDKAPHTPKDYLTEILDTCKKYPDIDFILGEMPRYLTNKTDREKLILERYYKLRVCKELVESYGYEWVDFCDHINEMGINPKKDQRDGDHMNHRGAKKVTKWLGKYIAEKCGVTTETHKGSDVATEFDQAYLDYVKNVDSKLIKKLKIPDDYNDL